MKRLMSMKQAKLLSLALNICFLMIHIILVGVFIYCGVEPMVRFNIFSVAFYGVMPLFIHMGWLRGFAVSVYMEVVAHMTAAVCFTGWNSGFQVTLIGMSILVYYSEYVGQYLQIPHVRATPLALIGMAAYLAGCVIDHSRPAPYPQPADMAFGFQMFWGVVVFAVTLFFLYTFVKLTSGSEALLFRKANHDQLTRLPNRYYVTDRLRALMDDAGLDGHWAAMLDIDDFKAVNDTYGHNCGDFILKSLADMLLASGIDMEVSRWGGEEFLMFGRLTEGLEARRAQLDDLRERIRQHDFVYESSYIAITVTIGLAEYQPGVPIREWIGAADQKLYEGKTSGKNRVVV